MGRFDQHVDSREEIALMSLLRCAADGEANVETHRQMLCELPTFEPYQMFKALQYDSVRCLLSLDDLKYWVRNQDWKATLLTDDEMSSIFQPFCSNVDEPYMRYEGFLKLVLPRDNPMIRSLAMTRHGDNFDYGPKNQLSRDVVERFVRLLEAEAQCHSETILRKRRLMDVEDQRLKYTSDIIHRTFRYLQTEASASVAGLAHLSLLSLRRMLYDATGGLTLSQVESLFRRINVSSSGMISFFEWEQFITTKNVDEFLTNLFLRRYTTTCPGCGVSVQRDGGACPQVTCSYCRMTFDCVTNVDGSTYQDTKSAFRPAAREAWRPTTTVAANERRSRTTTPGRLQLGDSFSSVSRSRVGSQSPVARRSYATENVLDASRRSTGFGHRSANRGDRFTQVSNSPSPVSRGQKPAWNIDESVSPRATSPVINRHSRSLASPSAGLDRSSRSFVSSPSPVNRLDRSSRSLFGSPRKSGNTFGSFQKDDLNASFNSTLASSHDNWSPKISPSIRPSRVSNKSSDSLNMVLDTMTHITATDLDMDLQKRNLQRLDVAPEAVFDYLDRYKKGYVADTDVWQVLHEDGSPGPVSFTGVCALFRELKPKGKQNEEPNKKYLGVADYVRQGPALGRLSLAEITHLICPVESEACKFVKRDMTDEETRTVLWELRNTVSCPGCGVRVQRTVEGCPGVTCPMCFTAFRCNKIENNQPSYHMKDNWIMTRATKMSVQKCLKSLISLCEQAERHRKNLSVSTWESLSSLLMDAYLEMENGKGYIDTIDLKEQMLRNGLRCDDYEIQTMLRRFGSRDNKIHYPEFADQLRPYAANTAISAY